MEELKDLKNRLKVFSNLGNVSYNHETTAILKGEIHGLREYNKSKSIIIQNLPKNENLLLRNKNKRNIHIITQV